MSADIVPNTTQARVTRGRHHQAVLQRLKNLLIAPEDGIPLTRETHPVSGQPRAVEGINHQDKDGRVKKQVDGGGGDGKSPAAAARACHQNIPPVVCSLFRKPAATSASTTNVKRNATAEPKG